MTLTKEQILSEIRRAAEANGGKPLGIGMFEKETGIKRSDWHGKYWARWGDALVEAGYSPNVLLGAYDRDSVIEHFVRLVRKFQHLPTSAEMRMEARLDGSLPHEGTFVRHLGQSPKERVMALREFCTIHEGYADVLAILPEAIAVEHENPRSSDKTTGDGFVYLLKSGRYYKIGRSNAVGRREYEIALQLPDKAMKVHEIRTDDPVGIERYWHRRFADRRKNGEWFDLTGDDVAAFRRRKFM